MRLLFGVGLLLFFHFFPLHSQGLWDISAYGMEHGLPDRTIYGHATDDHQLHWLATANGLCRFDGSQFFSFPMVGKVFIFSAFSSSSFSIDQYQRLIFQLVPESDSLEIFDLSSYTQQKIQAYQFPADWDSKKGKSSKMSSGLAYSPNQLSPLAARPENGLVASTSPPPRLIKIPTTTVAFDVDKTDKDGQLAGAVPTQRAVQFGESKFSGLLAKDNAPLYQIRRDGQQAYIFQLGKDNYWHLVYIVDELPALSSGQLADQIIHVDTASVVMYLGKQHQLLHLSAKGVRDYKLPGRLPRSAPFCHRDRTGRIWYLDASQQTIHCFSPSGEAIENPATKWMREAVAMEGRWWNTVWEDENNNLIFGIVGPNLTDQLLLLKQDGQLEDLAEVLQAENKIISIKGSDFREGFTIASHGGFYVCSRQSKELPITNYLSRELAPGQFGTVMRGFTQTDEAEPTIFVNTENSRWFKLTPPLYQLEALVKTDEAGLPLTERLDCSNNLVSAGGFIYGMSCRLDDDYTGYIHRYNPKTESWRHYDIPEHGAFARIIHPSSEEGKLWVFTLNRASRDNSIFLLDTDSGVFKQIGSLFHGLAKGEKGAVQYALTDEQGILWLVTTNGLYRLETKGEGTQEKTAANGSARLQEDNPYTIQAFFSPSGGRTYLTTLALLPDGRLLLGTFGNGLQIFDPATATFSRLAFKASGQAAETNTYNIPGLTNNNIAYIEPLNAHRFLVSTYDGFCVLDLRSRQIFAYSTADGFPSNEFNRLSLLIDRTGQLFVGGINGFSRLAVAVFNPAPIAAQPTLSRFFYLKEKARSENSQLLQVGELSSLTLASDVIYFGLDFALPAALPLKNKGFQTWLEGWEPGFGEMVPTPSVRYNRLAAGRYKLHIRGFNALGQQSREDLVIPIRVKPPWYKRAWFIIGGQLLIVLAIWSYNRQKVKRLRAEEARKRQQERRNAEMELKILRQQLNPHFIFNSLGAIQAYIQQQKGEEAVVYLANFARLMRLFLESSKQPYISIREELELLQLYIKLEQLRFQHRFTVSYSIDAQLDLDGEEIPSLLLQPFVENAINHGLFHLEGGGQLDIGMRLSGGAEDAILVCITDNGIGREMAGKIQEQSYRKHKSRATQIVAERLEILEQSGETQLSIHTEDAYPGQLQPGTRVLITISSKE